MNPVLIHLLFQNTFPLLLVSPTQDSWAEVREDLGYGVQEWGILEGLLM